LERSGSIVGRRMDGASIPRRVARSDTVLAQRRRPLRLGGDHSLGSPGQRCSCGGRDLDGVGVVDDDEL
jgi:hypothetical protein